MCDVVSSTQLTRSNGYYMSESDDCVSSPEPHLKHRNMEKPGEDKVDAIFGFLHVCSILQTFFFLNRSKYPSCLRWPVPASFSESDARNGGAASRRASANMGCGADWLERTVT